MQKFLLIFDKYFFYLVLTLLVFIPVYPKLPLFGVTGTFVSIRLEDLLIAAVTAVWVLGNYKKVKVLCSRTVVQSFLLFWFIGALSVLSGIFITYSVEPNLGLLHFVRRVEYMILFIIGATSVKNISQVKLALKIFLITAAIVIAYGFGQLYLKFPVISTTNSEFSKGIVLYLTDGARVNSTFAGHYDLAMYLSIVLMLLAVFFFSRKKLSDKFLILSTGVLGFFLLGLTAARVSFVATLVSLSLLFWLCKKKLLVLALIIVAFGLVIGIPELRYRLVATLTVNILGGGGPKYTPSPGAVNMFTPIKSIPESERAETLERIQRESTDPAKQNTGVSRDVVPGEPINTTELGVYRSFGIRFNVEWPRALNALYKNPVLGTGYSSITLASDNDYLRSLGEVGVLGTISFTLIFVILFKKMIMYINRVTGFERFYIVGMMSSTVALLLTATFIDVFEASKIAEIYWLLMGFAWAIMVDFDKGMKDGQE